MTLLFLILLLTPETTLGYLLIDITWKTDGIIYRFFQCDFSTNLNTSAVLCFLLQIIKCSLHAFRIRMWSSAFYLKKKLSVVIYGLIWCQASEFSKATAFMSSDCFLDAQHDSPIFMSTLISCWGVTSLALSDIIIKRTAFQFHI